MSDELDELRTQVDMLEEKVQELERRLDNNEDLIVAEGIGELLESFNPSSHTERALCIAYYLESYRGMENFSVVDIEDGYRECRIKPANNMSDVLGRMENRDWLLRDGKEGNTQLWRLTAGAIKTVEEEINNES